MVSKLQCYLDRTVQGAVKFWIRVAFFFLFQGPGLGWIRIFWNARSGAVPSGPLKLPVFAEIRTKYLKNSLVLPVFGVTFSIPG